MNPFDRPQRFEEAPTLFGRDKKVDPGSEDRDRDAHLRPCCRRAFDQIAHVAQESQGEFVQTERRFAEFSLPLWDSRKGNGVRASIHEPLRTQPERRPETAHGFEKRSDPRWGPLPKCYHRHEKESSGDAARQPRRSNQRQLCTHAVSRQEDGGAGILRSDQLQKIAEIGQHRFHVETGTPPFHIWIKSLPANVPAGCNNPARSQPLAQRGEVFKPTPQPVHDHHHRPNRRIGLPLPPIEAVAGAGGKASGISSERHREFCCMPGSLLESLCSMKTLSFCLLLLAVVVVSPQTASAGRLDIAVIQYGDARDANEQATAFAGEDLFKITDSDSVESSNAAIRGGKVVFAQSIVNSPGSSFAYSTRIGGSRADVSGSLASSNVQVEITVQEGVNIGLRKFRSNSYSASGAISAGQASIIGIQASRGKTASAIKGKQQVVNTNFSTLIVAQYVE